jgi:hypothetical protein
MNNHVAGQHMRMPMVILFGSSDESTLQKNRPGSHPKPRAFTHAAKFVYPQTHYLCRFASHSFRRGHVFFALFPSQSPQMVMS